jgi:hypothetical protein
MHVVIRTAAVAVMACFLLGSWGPYSQLAMRMRLVKPIGLAALWTSFALILVVIAEVIVVSRGEGGITRDVWLDILFVSALIAVLCGIALYAMTHYASVI